MNKKFLDLGFQPLANEYLAKNFGNKKKYKLKIFFNTKTKLVSISKKMDSKEMFTSKYPYRSSLSQTMRDSFKTLSEEIKKKFKPKLLLEIGSNDGALIKNFKKTDVIGVEPCTNLAKITKAHNYNVYDEYWDTKLAQKLKKKFNNVDLIYSANTLTHIGNLDNVFKSISILLSNKGSLIIEDPSLLECLKNNSYDQFYNEHIYVFSLIALNNILKKFNLEVYDVKNLSTHGGSLRYYIKKKINKNIKIKNSVKKQLIKEKKFKLDKFSTYKKFETRVLRSKKNLLDILEELNKNNKKIIGYGATAKATTVLNFCKIKKDLIKCFVDTTPEKQNKYMPGTNIKILKYNKNTITNFDYLFLGAWNFKKEILNKEKKFIKKGGKFITHVPIPKII